ncbi:MAG: glycosyltransferase family 2 protein [Aphanizomenon gracile PMC649.10]|uniref:glycosyltransferase family 2 protein n=1 Tax=Dolichospermum sp. LEGE 00240 TaxID=1828603 RepID=UPI001D15ADEE|nr:glycosyltransferase family 2 protein [Dolichospermum sp. LEGE 00240]MDM3854589.1 glycosyltransferase family 2 protein [Aphanizomenon gracile PMC649.10]
MEKTIRITASLVLYKNNPEMIYKTVLSTISTPLKINLCVVDNSPSPDLETVLQDLENVEYYYNKGDNVGFGKAHNIAISRCGVSDYHLVLNPDIYFDENVIPQLIDYLESNQEVGLIQPKIFFPNGETQYLCKRYPTILALFARRFLPKPLHFLLKSYLDWYEMRDMGYDKTAEVLYLSGCFMLFRKKYLDEIGYFDEDIFMYFEDADITLRMAKKYKTVFYPHVHIFHHWAKGSYKVLNLTIINIQSAIYFFNKHGWKLF